MLASYFEGRTQNIFECLSEIKKHKFKAIQKAKKNLRCSSLQFLNQSKLLSGVRHDPEKDLLTYSRRVLNLTKEYMLSRTLENVIKDFAMGHFLKYIANKQVWDLLILQKK